MIEQHTTHKEQQRERERGRGRGRRRNKTRRPTPVSVSDRPSHSVAEVQDDYNGNERGHLYEQQRQPTATSTTTHQNFSSTNLQPEPEPSEFGQYSTAGTGVPHNQTATNFARSQPQPAQPQSNSSDLSKIMDTLAYLMHTQLETQFTVEQLQSTLKEQRTMLPPPAQVGVVRICSAFC